MTPDPADATAAEHAATQALLNCYLRETDTWRIEGIDGETLVIEPPGAGFSLRVGLRFRSRTFQHRYHLPVKLASGRQAVSIGFTALAGLLLDTLDMPTAPPAPDTGDRPDRPPPPGRRGSPRPDAQLQLTTRILASVHNVATFLTARRPEIDRLWGPEPLSFIRSEQAQLLGHPLHPTPKSRQPMGPDDLASFSPETAGQFPLQWLAVDADLVRQGSATGVPATDLAAELAELAGVPDTSGDRVVLPAHPWEFRHLRDKPPVADLLAAGRLVDLGRHGPPVTPTTSVRTVFAADWPWQLKFSLHVRVTNSERVTLPKELDRAVEAASLWHRTTVGTAARQVAPAFSCIHDPAYLTVAVPDAGTPDARTADGPVIDGLSVLFRENPWRSGDPGAGADVTSLTSLCQDHPFRGRSRLAAVVDRLAGTGGRRVTEVGRAWFGNFLDVAVVSLIRLYLDLGLCFEPHQQNTLIELEAGWPVRCFYRDSQGYFHREAAHDDLCRIVPHLGEATESVFPESLADERLVYYPFMNLTLGVINALAAGGCASEEVLLGDLRHCLAKERSRGGRYPATLLDRLLDDPAWPCKGNLRTRWHGLDELVGDIADQSVYVTVPNPLRSLG